MLTLDPLALPHVVALCAAIDAGDDTALPALADALEEAGKEAAGLRFAHANRKSPNGSLMRTGPYCWPYCWFFARKRSWAGMHPDRHTIVIAPPKKSGWGPNYPTRSAAYLALAAALTETTAPA